VTRSSAAILLFLVVAITDARNTAPAANLAPVVIGLLVVAIGMAWGSDAGYAINPARDFGPRLA
jgi:glycerol uptake facilitator protein